MKTLYISDLDGTLLGKDVEVSPYSVEIINERITEGMYFTCATARTAASTLTLLADIQINVPMVLMNGVCVYDAKTNEYLKVSYLEKKQTSFILEELKKANITGFMYEINDNTLRTYYESLESKALKDFHDERVLKYQKVFTKVSDFSDLALDHIVYFCLLDEKEKLITLYQEISALSDVKAEFYKDIYSEDLWYLEIFSKEATKYNAVQYLRKLYEFDKVIGFGDNLNDLPLFRACDECYAVSNAKDEVKKAATAIIDSNSNNAVANWLKSHSSL